MLIKKIDNPNLINTIRQILYKEEYKDYVSELLTRLKDYSLYLWGGAVRDCVAKHLHNANNEISDLDFLVDDSHKELNPKKILRGLNGLSYTRFGSPRWKPIPGLEIDIIPFTNALTHIFSVRDEKIKPVKAKSIEEVLANTDFTVNALAYDLQKNIIYDYGAINAINSKEIEFLLPRDKIQVTVSKIILFSDKLGFSIGKKAREFIKQEYEPATDDKIIKYLEYKGYKNKSDYLINRLKEIKSEIS